jgi:hypothetical protein
MNRRRAISRDQQLNATASEDSRIVTTPEKFAWSSYRARIGLIESDWLDPDPGFISLGPDKLETGAVRMLVEQRITDFELRFFRDAVQRNQLTRSEAFVLGIGQRIGQRILFRSRSRPSSRAQPK